MEKIEFQELIKQLSKEELMNIMLSIADDIPLLQEIIMTKYREINPKEIIAEFKLLMRKVVKSYQRGNYLSCYVVRGLMNELRDLADQAVERSERGQYMVALDMAIVLFDEGVRAFQYADDSDGDIGEFVSEMLGLMDYIVKQSINASTEMRQALCKRLIKKAKAKNLEDWGDYRADLFEISTQYGDQATNYNLLMKEIEKYIIEYDVEEFSYGGYLSNRLAVVLTTMIKQYGTEGQLQNFLSQHDKRETVLEWMMEQHFEAGEFEDALKIAIKGEKLAKGFKKHDWMKARYRAYVALNRLDGQYEMSQKLLLEGFFEYYEPFKVLMGVSFKEVYPTIKEKMKQNSHLYVGHAYLKVLEAEKDYPALLELVQEKNYWIEEYAQLLYPIYPKEIETLFTNYILELSQSASNRGKYKAVCYKLRQFGEICGISKREALTLQLKNLYPKRQVFHEELACFF